MKRIIKDAGKINATGNIIITAILIILVYGSYFLATYYSSRQILLSQNSGGQIIT